MASNSNIRVFVQWSEQTVFSGEDIECQITFRNVSINNVSTPLPPSTGLNGHSLNWGKQRKTAPMQAKAILNKNHIITDTRTMPVNRGHRARLSLNLPTRDRSSQHDSVLRNGAPTEGVTKEHSHRPSVSIISLGIFEGVGDEAASQLSPRENAGTSRGHTRASSLQFIPRRSVADVNGPIPVSISQKSTTQPSLFHPSSPKGLNKRSDISSHETLFRTEQQSGIITTPGSVSMAKTYNMRRSDSGSLPQNFSFSTAAILQTGQRLPDIPQHEESLGRPDAAIPQKLLFPRSREVSPTIREQTNSSIRVLSTESSEGTPRSSGDLYSLSNNSIETLASESLAQTSRLHPRVNHNSSLASLNQPRPLETLMMGYAQICGTYTLDSSLINLAPFDDVKRKGALGGRGGGVIGLETNKKESRVFRGFGWGNFGESLGGLLVGDKSSSIKEMRGAASTKSIPLLLTPQSILFVDLRLAPGESRSYKYSFKLPSGLPPSYRGKTIKIAYNLIIGTQRPGDTRDQQVKSIEVPFRVLGGVNEQGEPLSHDLMSPYIILRDSAPIQWLDIQPAESATAKPIEPALETPLNEFLTYANNLLLQPHLLPSIDQLSPTETTQSRQSSRFRESRSVRESVEIAILRSNIATESRRSANRFNISRDGHRVAVVILARPAYRLGETITAAIDFTEAEIPCYAIYAALETSEKVDPAIALRSSSTIHRVTRRTYFSHSESTLFSQRVIFRPTIPISCSPSFITSGVSLEWKILMEFVTPSLEVYKNSTFKKSWKLLEGVYKDDRGVVLGATDILDCESFEVSVPIRVYGAPVGNNKVEVTDGFQV